MRRGRVEAEAEATTHPVGRGSGGWGSSSSHARALANAAPACCVHAWRGGCHRRAGRGSGRGWAWRKEGCRIGWPCRRQPAERRRRTTSPRHLPTSAAHPPVCSAHPLHSGTQLRSPHPAAPSAASRTLLHAHIAGASDIQPPARPARNQRRRPPPPAPAAPRATPAAACGIAHTPQTSSTREREVPAALPACTGPPSSTPPPQPPSALRRGAHPPGLRPFDA